MAQLPEEAPAEAQGEEGWFWKSQAVMICANKLLPSRLPPSCFYKKQVQIIQILQPISKAKRERKRKQRGRERQKELAGYAEEEEERKMVNYMLKITAEVENVKSLQPMGGCDDPNFTFYFKVS